MIRKVLKKTSQHKKLHEFVKKYKIPQEYLSTNRKMVSKAILIGLFIAFIPMPMQMLAILVFIPFVKFNVPIALAMCWVSNPLTMPVIYYVEYLTGSLLLGTKVEPVQMTLEWFTNNLDDIFIPLYVGTLVYSIVISLSAYWLVNHFWRKSVDKSRKVPRNER